MIDTRGVHFREFDGSVSNWEQWAHPFRCAVRTASPKALEFMEEAERVPAEATDGQMSDDSIEDDGEVEKMLGELYAVLSQYCTGEALTIVRSV